MISDLTEAEIAQPCSYSEVFGGERWCDAHDSAAPCPFEVVEVVENCGCSANCERAALPGCDACALYPERRCGSVVA